MARARSLRRLVLALLSLTCAHLLWAGGPLLVTGPAFNNGAGHSITWDPANPVAYRTDSTGLGKLTNAQALARVRAMFDVWENIPTSSIRYNRIGPLTTPAGGSVVTVSDYNAARGACTTNDAASRQSPIIFDADGSIFEALHGANSGVIGFAGPCLFNFAGRIISGLAVMNGRFLDGVNNPPSNRELSDDAFDAAFIHEFGHFSGLDHSQINVNCVSVSQCAASDHDGVPTMFPFLVGEFMKSLSQDDIAWISRLYPRSPEFGQGYGAISGTIFFSDGITQAQGVNVIARRVENGVPSRSFAVSVVSGYRFTHNPGQPFTANYLACTPGAPGCHPSGFLGNNTAGSTFGSRDPALLGFYEISVPPGEYFVEVEAIHSAFTGGSSVGPLDPPLRLPGGLPEFWDENESANDDAAARSPVTVSPGQTTPNIDIILNGTPPRFDQFEDSDVTLLEPPPLLARREEVRA